MDQQDLTKEPTVEGTFLSSGFIGISINTHLANDYNNIALEFGSSEEDSDFLTTQSSADSSDEWDACVSECWQHIE